jgi:tetratricopeptide (TPR) repeat protein
MNHNNSAHRLALRGWLGFLLTCGLFGLALAAVFLFWRPPIENMERAMIHNLRGVGQMERYEYAAAEKSFTEAAKAAPSWLPAQINRGIALFNQDEPAKLDAAREIFLRILDQDPNQKHAHYCLGIICATRGPMEEAHAYFQTVQQLDSSDAHTLLWLGLTHPDGKDSPGAQTFFEQALQRNPYLNAARYNLALAVNATDPERAAKLFEEHKALVAALWEMESGIRYGEMGRYSEVIGRSDRPRRADVGPLPLFSPQAVRVQLAPGTRWAKADDRPATFRAAQTRFGSTIVCLDSNNNDRPDLLLLAAVVRGGKLGNLLLRNEADGQLVDISAEAGLADAPPGIGAAAADFDNDGWVDLVVTGIGSPRLYRNRGDGTFTDVSKAAGLDTLQGIYLGCQWLDLDQDGDLDLVLCRYTTQQTSSFTEPAEGGGLEIWENIGVAPPTPAGGPPPALSVAFRRREDVSNLITGSTIALIGTDIDADRDVDMLILADRSEPVVLKNDRLFRFRRNVPRWATNLMSSWNSGLILDANHDQRSDLFLLLPDSPPLFLLSKGETDFTQGKTNSPALRQAVATDLDLDGWPDIVGLGQKGEIVFLHNQADGRLQRVVDSFDTGKEAVGVSVADFDGDGLPDVLVLIHEDMIILKNRGNGHSGLWVWPTGRRDRATDLRTNADGIGSWLVAQSGPVWSATERTTSAAGLGQSSLPTLLALGRNDRADVLRVRWPDAVIQAELGVASGRFRLTQTNRKGTSCPVLLAWDGSRFAFITDFLGASALGELGPDGSVRPPRGEESVTIESDQLVAREGEFLLKITEPMDEVLYLDHLKLEVIDHPHNATIYPDERFVFQGPAPTQQLQAFRERHLPCRALNHRGQDVTAQLQKRDTRAVDGFARRSWLGYAEDHHVLLEFPEVSGQERWVLLLAGWTEYPYPESIWAATQAGVQLRPPVVEQRDAKGQWQPLADLGFPAGLPRVMTHSLPKGFRGGTLRISTNMQVFWDRIELARLEPLDSVGRVTTLEVKRADLSPRGFLQEIYPQGRPPLAYDDAKTEPVEVTRWKGRLTRFGDVTALLNAADDRLVLCGPGEEILVRFDATGLPALKEGHKRTFVLRTHGYCKDTATTTLSGGEVFPLPFRAMKNYPEFGHPPPKTDALRWHTRALGPIKVQANR